MMTMTVEVGELWTARADMGDEDARDEVLVIGHCDARLTLQT
jgi:hypothetical protein